MNKRESKKFNSLYNKFQQTLVLQGYSDPTIDCYTRGVRRVSEYFDCCPDKRLS